MSIPFRDAWRYWLKLGFISFGGPAGQIALMHAELVERRRWISENRFLHALNYCMLLPGPEAQQLATYLGWLMHRTWGGIVAGALFVLPSWFVLAALSAIYVSWGNLPWVAAIFAGIKPAVTAVVVVSATRLAKRALKKAWMVVLALVSFVALSVFQLDFPLIVLAAGITGWVVLRLKPDWIVVGGGGHGGPKAGQQKGDSQGQQTAQPPYIIDEDTPLPLHAKLQPRRVVLVMALGIGTAALALAALTFTFGTGHVLTQMGLFFTQAALVTFGGAYAVLPYVQQAAVDTHGWLSAGQMIDGMALGETTPGPLIMIVAFVGFLGAYTQQALGGEHLWAGALLGSAVATFFTFLPSFVFILAGAPWVEATRGKVGFAAPLQAITAAVVGVMANLALFFARHSIWPHEFYSGPSVLAVSLVMLAMGMLLQLKYSVAKTIVVCGILGLLAHAMGG
jgi:chromate transporter